ncbi:MKI67 FHA domain-interacting nucleolar phosphoprotein-like isoform X2 [Oncorhynchus masou masou]|uniref:MKI67 FHA domain-interacting nucleolar phosphoprotein-like isoform X2 n=1 Tax=Oncorhynchus masou masou TaxID=90313 RepID=UPI00318440EE
MRETKAPVVTKPAKAFLALNLKEDPEFKTKVQEMKKRHKKGQQTSPRGIYVGHLPTGLFEPQLKSYIEQFGNVVRLQQARSKTTGGVRLIVTKIVAETMNNYLMGNQVPTEVHLGVVCGITKSF